MTFVKLYLARHGQAEVNKGHNDAAIDEWESPLTEKGWNQAVLLGQRYREVGINPISERVEVSKLLRSHQTALGAGWQAEDMVVNALLNEVSVQRGKTAIMREVVRGKVPIESRRAGAALLDNPPANRACVSHALTIIGACHEAGTPYYELTGQKLPGFGEIVTIEL